MKEPQEIYGLWCNHQNAIVATGSLEFIKRYPSSGNARKIMKRDGTKAPFGWKEIFQAERGSK